MGNLKDLVLYREMALDSLHDLHNLHIYEQGVKDTLQQHGHRKYPYMKRIKIILKVKSHDAWVLA